MEHGRPSFIHIAYEMAIAIAMVNIILHGAEGLLIIAAKTDLDLSRVLAVERLHHYVERIPRETSVAPSNAAAGAATPEPTLPAGWPLEGAVSIRGLRMRYRPGLPLVLRGVDLDVRPGERIGIVGRTGSGKSSLIQALLRIVESEWASGSRILIDGARIDRVPLRTLRGEVENDVSKLKPSEPPCVGAPIPLFTNARAVRHGDGAIGGGGLPLPDFTWVGWGKQPPWCQLSAQLRSEAARHGQWSARDARAVQTIHQAGWQNTGTYANLITAIALSDLFQTQPSEDNP